MVYHTSVEQPPRFYTNEEIQAALDDLERTGDIVPSAGLEQLKLLLNRRLDVAQPLEDRS